MRRIRLAFATVAFMMTSFAANTYHFNLQEPASFNGTMLRPGDYKIVVDGDKATIKVGKTAVEAPAKVETAERKYPTTTISFDDSATRKSITEIHIGGSTTRIVISSGAATGR